MNRPLLAFAALLLPSPAFADTLIDNVNGIQVGADGKLDRFRGLVLSDNGKVLQVLRGDDDLIRPFTQRIDGQGRTLLPGLIDAHGHVMLLGLSALQLDLIGTSSLADLKERLRRYAEENTGSGWIQGRGWNQELWPGKRFPSAADLDAVVADRPVALERVDGHAFVVNSAALKAAGITAATKDAPGGRIERDPRGNPTGVLVDAAADMVVAKIPPPSPEMRERALAKAQELMLSSGLTAAADMGTSPEDWSVMHAAGKKGRLQVRIMAYSLGLKPVETIARMGPTQWLFENRLRMGGVKLYADGALGSRGAWLKRPYADNPETSGLRFLSDAELRDRAGRAAATGYQLAIHAIGDAANAQVIAIYEELSRKYGRERRWRIEHAQVIDPADIPRLAPAGIIASMQPTHQVSDRTMAEARLGPARLAGSYAWQTIARSGARLAFGSDFPVESSNPFPGLAAAISRQDANGVPPGGWRPEDRLTFEQALAGFTRDAAYAGFAERQIGSLEPGKWADFIMIDRDISKVPGPAIWSTQVLETWVAGKKVWERTASRGPERGK